MKGQIVEKNSIYVKQFSEIDNLQFKKIVEYNICEKNIKNIKIYGISISEYFKNESKNDKIFISENYNLTLKILMFLYENSIGIHHCKEIIEDILWKLEQKS